MGIKNTTKNFLFFAYAFWDPGFSGGDRILVEFARKFAEKGSSVDIYTWERGERICKREKLFSSRVKYHVSHIEKFLPVGFFFHYLLRIIISIKVGVGLSVQKPEKTVLYSSSDFIMDVIPCALLKIRYPALTWVATWYQTAPSPLKGYAEEKRSKAYRTNAFFYWVSQALVKPFISLLSDLVFVNNESERVRFPRHNRENRVAVVIGAVNLKPVKEFRKKNKFLKKKFDAVFQGRFHPQKGVTELISIWKYVVKKIPNAKLAMIGGGTLENEVRQEIKANKLGGNIYLAGYVFDGPEKYTLFSESKLVVHPAFYDSGGMASGEAMAFGIPCVAFDLESYKSYYPKGMVKVRSGSIKDFADAVIKLLDNDKLRKKIGKEAEDLIFSQWSWDSRSESILSFIHAYEK